MVSECHRLPQSVKSSVFRHFLQPVSIFTRDSVSRSRDGIFSTPGDADVCDGNCGVFGAGKVECVHRECVVVALRRRKSVSVIDEYLKDVSTEEEAKESSPVGLLALFVGSFASAMYYNLQKITLRKKRTRR